MWGGERIEITGATNSTTFSIYYSPRQFPFLSLSAASHLYRRAFAFDERMRESSLVVELLMFYEGDEVLVESEEGVHIKI